MTKLIMLKAACFQKGITLDELRQRSGINRVYLSQGMNGRLNFTSDEKLRIANAVGCTVQELFPE